MKSVSEQRERIIGLKSEMPSAKDVPDGTIYECLTDGTVYIAYHWMWYEKKNDEVDLGEVTTKIENIESDLSDVGTTIENIESDLSDVGTTIENIESDLVDANAKIETRLPFLAIASELGDDVHHKVSVDCDFTDTTKNYYGLIYANTPEGRLFAFTLNEGGYSISNLTDGEYEFSLTFSRPAYDNFIISGSTTDSFVVILLNYPY